MNKKTLTYEIVNGELIWIREDITELVIPNGVTIVKDGVIPETLRKIVFPDSVDYFYIPKNNSIEEIVFPRTLKAYQKRSKPVEMRGFTSEYQERNFGLGNLHNLKVASIPFEYYYYYYFGKPHDEYEEIKKSSFYGIESDKIVIRYENLEQLLNYDYNKISRLFPKEIKNIRIEFEGPKLNNKERRQVKHKLKYMYKNISISFIEPRVYEEKEEQKINDSEIQTLLNRINAICINLPENTRKTILENVTNLVLNYIKEKEKYSPKYSKETEPIKLDIGDIVTLKNMLLINLEKIIFDLTDKQTIIDYLQTIDKYKRIIHSTITDFSNETSMEANVKNIIYLTSKLSPKKKEQIIKQLDDYLNNAYNHISNQLKGVQDNQQLTLTTDSPSSYMQDLEMDIIRTLEKTQLLADKVIPFIKLLDCINNKEMNVDKNDTSIVSDIVKIRYILSKLKNETFKEELESEFNTILNQHKERIELILNNDYEQEKTTYEIFILGLRKDLEPFFIKLNKYAHQEQFDLNIPTKDAKGHLFKTIKTKDGKKKTISYKEIISDQITKSIEIVKGQRRIDKTIAAEAITSFAVEVFLDINHNDVLSNEDKVVITNDLLEALNSSHEFIQTKQIDSLKEYNELIRIVLGKIADIKLRTMTYVNRITEFNKHAI